MRRHGLCGLFVLSTLSIKAYSATGVNPRDASPENRIKIEDAADKKNKVAGDIDEEITNDKIRADSGSKSKFSLSTGLNYKGGSVSHPFGTERPNLRGLPENQIDTSLDANAKIRYRRTKNLSFTGGVTLGVKTPLHGDVNESQNQTNVGDPVLSSNYTFARAGLQHSWNMNASAGTSQESMNIDQSASVATDYTLVKTFHNGIHLGVQGATWHNFYDSAPGDNKPTTIAGDSNKVDRRNAWVTTVFPFFEYKISDKVAFRTLFGYFGWTHLYGDRENWRLLRMKEYQSVGLGIAVLRDVYLYPNVQFLPRDIRMKYTNVGLQASINVF